MMLELAEAQAEAQAATDAAALPEGQRPPTAPPPPPKEETPAKVIQAAPEDKGKAHYETGEIFSCKLSIYCLLY